MTAPREETAPSEPFSLEARVRTLLDAAGLPANERELAGLVAAYTTQRPAVDGLFNVAAARYAEPVLTPDVPVRATGRAADGRPA
ncbi:MULTISPECIES: hypothetical protein [Actinomadura]|uniref:Amidase n=1 Tax=Actinomadura yumaensis TaxID=111807 RepID=A0ABW2CTM3_9ACTN|nr:hypothetical protein [Actinomadura sp. J1-007]MWK40436.1 hypothetical protein [Actinomadura sp. J1-007]